MNILSSILDRLNQRIEVGNIFDQIYGLSELVGEGNDKAWAFYMGNGQAIPVTNYDAKQGTLFWAKRGKITVSKNDSLRLAGCKSIYETRFTLTAYAMVRKSHLPCDSADANDWVASRVLRLISGTDPQFKTAIGAIAYEVVPSGYATEARYLPVNYEWAAVAIEVDVNVSTSSEDGCYDTCQTGDIPLPDFEPCEPCLTSVAVDGVTITGNGTPSDPLVAIGGGGGTPLRTQDEGVNVSTNTTTLNFTGAGVTASLTSPGVVQVNVPGGGGGGGVTSVTASAPLASSGGTTPDISIPQASASVDGYLDSADFATFAGKQDALTAGTGIDLTGNIVTNTAPDQTVVLNDGTGIQVTGTYPNFTITNTSPSSGGTVTSVAATVPSPTNPAFSVAVPNPTTTPSVNITANGTTSQYVRGDGSLETFPTIPVVTGFVPYTGATQDLDMGTHNVTADHIALNVSPSGAGFVVGATQWNNTIGSSETLLKGGNVTLKNGVDLVARIVNKVTPNTTLTKAAYQAVRVSGATGGRLSVELAKADTDNNSADTIGLVTETIATNQEGFIMTVGQLLDINTTGSLQGETWADGDVLYLSPTTAGRLTNIKPTGATGHIVVMGYVEYAHPNNGAIYVKVMNGWELDELHNVYINAPANNDALVYESATQLWKNKSLGTILGGTTSQYVRGDGSLATFPTIPTGTVTSVGLSMPSAFSVANSPVTGAGTLTVTGAGTTAQYVRGDGSLASFPSLPLIFKTTVDSAGFSSITNTVVYTQAITANTFTTGDIIRITYRTRKTGTAGNQTLRMYTNTTANLSGTPILLGSWQNTAANTFLFNSFQRNLVIKNNLNNTEVLFAPTLTQSTDFFLANSATTCAIDWTINQFIVFAIQNTNAADVNFGSMYLIEKL